MTIAATVAVLVTFASLAAVVVDAAADLRHRLRGPRRGSMLGVGESPAITRVFS